MGWVKLMADVLVSCLLKASQHALCSCTLTYQCRSVGQAAHGDCITQVHVAVWPQSLCGLVQACSSIKYMAPCSLNVGNGVLSVVYTCLQYFTIKMQDGVVATSYANGDKFYIDPMKLLPLDRFLPKPKGSSAGITKGEAFVPLPELPMHVWYELAYEAACHLSSCVSHATGASMLLQPHCLWLLSGSNPAEIAAVEYVSELAGSVIYELLTAKLTHAAKQSA